MPALLGLGNVRLSGFVIDTEMRLLFARYVGGKLSRGELNAEVLIMAGLHPYRAESGSDR